MSEKQKQEQKSKPQKDQEQQDQEQQHQQQQHLMRQKEDRQRDTQAFFGFPVVLVVFRSVASCRRNLDRDGHWPSDHSFSADFPPGPPRCRHRRRRRSLGR